MKKVLVNNIHFFFFFNDTATTEIYTLSLHDALPISPVYALAAESFRQASRLFACTPFFLWSFPRSEEHTSELQSRLHLVCRLLLEKKKSRCVHTAASAPPCNSGPRCRVTPGLGYSAT